MNGEAADRRCPEDPNLTIREAFALERPHLLPLPEQLRIPVQRCHLIQAKAATHSMAKLPPIPVKVATL
jgi:hypothetical protein